MNYSVLMSVYYKESSLHLRRSVSSIMEQTIVPNDFVIVCDGPLTIELDNELANLKDIYPCINLIRKENNEGLGSALHDGLLQTKNDIVMRMDSDDVCMPKRAEIQLPYMKEYDLVGGVVSEFDGSEDNLIGYRRLPKTYEEILKFAKRRSPFNHPSVMYKKSIILKSGNYQTLLFVEDYFLWVRVLENTNKVINIDEILVNMRSGLSMRSRRGGKTYRKSLKFLRKYMYKHKMISLPTYCALMVEQTIFLLLPTRFKNFLYSKFLRSPSKT